MNVYALLSRVVALCKPLRYWWPVEFLVSVWMRQMISFGEVDSLYFGAACVLKLH